MDRLRKARAETQEVAERRWQLWLVIGIGVANIIAAVTIAPRKPAG